MTNVIRSKRIILTSFCVFNQNAVINEWERAKGAFPFVNLLTDSGLGIMQLPCPEVLCLGCTRPPKDYDGYNTAEHRRACQKMLETTFLQLDQFIKAEYEIVGLIGIHESPNCSITGERGVFMEEFFSSWEKRRLPLPYLEVPPSYPFEGKEAFEAQIKEFIQ